MLAIEVDQKGLEVMAKAIAATEDQVVISRTRALRKTQKEVETFIKRYVAKAERIPQRAIADRFFSEKVAPGDDTASVWIGAWAVDPFSLGSPTAYGRVGVSGGVKVGRGRNYTGAFLAQIYTDQQKVWIRLKSKHYSPAIYPAHYRPGDRGLSRNNRFPVVRAAIPIDKHVEKVLAQNESYFASVFEKKFEQEFNYEVLVKGERG